MKYSQIPKDSILHEPKYEALVSDLENICKVAGMYNSMQYVWNTANGALNDYEIGWILEYHKQHEIGYFLALFSGKHAIAQDKMMRMVGAFLRNFIDARIYPLDEVLESEVIADCRVLFIPDFHFSDLSSNTPKWRVKKIYDMLQNRSRAGKQTVLYCQAANLQSNYGKLMESYIREQGVHL